MEKKTAGQVVFELFVAHIANDGSQWANLNGFAKAMWEDLGRAVKAELAKQGGDHA